MTTTAPTVLVAYGSKGGSTAQLAEWIAHRLVGYGLDATAVPAARVAGVEAYDAVIIGGALYARRWHRDARRFARRHAAALRWRPVWLFSSGPLDDTASRGDIAPVAGVKAIADHLGARGHITFGGRLDETAPSWIARKMVEHGQGGDFRDRPQVEAWADSIAAVLGAAAAA
jgi:menaquinone-dependent protoporphyrinogen oxidase